MKRKIRREFTSDRPWRQCTVSEYIECSIESSHRCIISVQAGIACEVRLWRSVLRTCIRRTVRHVPRTRKYHSRLQNQSKWSGMFPDRFLNLSFSKAHRQLTYLSHPTYNSLNGSLLCILSWYISKAAICSPEPIRTATLAYPRYPWAARSQTRS